MGFYLSRGEEVEKRYGISRWPAMINLARAFGWESAGTILDDESGVTPIGKWSGSYEDMAYQLVTAQDANNLADAIERALAYFPRQDQERTLAYQVKTNWWRPPNEYENKALRWFFKEPEAIEPEEKSLADFVDYCRKGAFRIF